MNLFSATTVADVVCPYVLERFFQPVLKKRVKITRYFNKTDRLAYAFRLGEFWDRNVHGNGLTEFVLSVGTLVSLNSHHVIPTLG
jgi:hypothetical protein